MRSRFMISAVLAAAVLGGCKKEEAANPTNPGPTGTPTTKPSVKTTVPTTAISSTAGGLTRSATDTVGSLTSSVPAVPTVPVTPTATVPDVTPTISAPSAAWGKKFSDLSGYIAAGNYDAADKALKDLEAKKADLPANMADQLPNLRKGVDALKSTSGHTAVPTTMPTLPH